MVINNVQKVIILLYLILINKGIWLAPFTEGDSKLLVLDVEGSDGIERNIENKADVKLSINFI